MLKQNCAFAVWFLGVLILGVMLAAPVLGQYNSCINDTPCDQQCGYAERTSGTEDNSACFKWVVCLARLQLDLWLH
jgi:hypothetical protein